MEVKKVSTSLKLAVLINNRRDIFLWHDRKTLCIHKKKH